MVRRVTKGNHLKFIAPMSSYASSFDDIKLLLNAVQRALHCALTAHEVMEVDGFLFKRKRRVPLGESANVLASAKKAKTQQKVVDGQIVEEEDSVQAGPKRAADNMHSLLVYSSTPLSKHLFSVSAYCTGASCSQGLVVSLALQASAVPAPCPPAPPLSEQAPPLQ